MESEKICNRRINHPYQRNYELSLKFMTLQQILKGITLKRSLFLFVCLLIGNFSAVAQNDPPEVVLEAYSSGFHRPLLRLTSSTDSLLVKADYPDIKMFSDRLQFALKWSGYVKLALAEDSLAVGPSPIPFTGGPPTDLLLHFSDNGVNRYARISLAEPGEQPFYSGGIEFDSLSAERAADAAAEGILYELTGMTPPFRSRIVCVEKRPDNIKELVLVAYDGGKRSTLTRDQSVALSPAWSPDAKKIAFCSFRGGRDSDIYIADLDKLKIVKLLERIGTDAAPVWSPNGKWIAFAGSSGYKTDIFLVKSNGTGLRNLTLHSSINTYPGWSPTGRELVFMSDRSGTPQIYKMDIDGANLMPLTLEGKYNADPSWSPRGDLIVYLRRERSGFQVRIMDPSGDRDLALTDEPGDHLDPCWSPDGMKIAYSYKGKVWVMNADGSAKTPLLAEGLMPDWSPVKTGY